MVDVRSVAPDATVVDAAELVAKVRQAQLSLAPFDERILDFTNDLSRQLRHAALAADEPAVAALAYWIRPSNTKRLKVEWELLCADERFVRLPRGVVFHLPPTNVDTLFVYSWLLSALVGNANIVRLSPSAVDSGSLLLDVVARVLPAHPAVAATTTLLSYGHEERITAALSTADVRVIWGGDDTVQAIRRVPLAPHATELAFADRFSMCALDAASVASANDEEMRALAAGFFNDAYWFDQLGCASPRAVVWVGEPDVCNSASRRFSAAVHDELDRRRTEVATSAAVAKLVHVADAAAAGGVERADWADNRMTVARMSAGSSILRDGPGGGLFYEVVVSNLNALVADIERRDQTLTYFGFDQSTIRTLARSLSSRGIDRIVPIGQALSFDRFWDGVDLLQSFTRLVAVA